MSFKWIPSIIVFSAFSLMLFSCDLFLGLPHLRENPADEERQISSLIASAPDQSSVSLRFVWVPPSRWSSSEEQIDEVILLWSDKRFPDSRIPTFLNGYSSKTYSTIGFHEAVESSLSPGDTIYAALFAHSEMGWHAPKYALKKIPSSTPPVQGPANFTYGYVFGFYIEYSSPENFLAFEETTTAVSLGKNVSSENNSVIYFSTTVPADATCTLATLNVTSSAAVLAEIYPVVHKWEPFNDGGSEAFYRFQNRLYDESIKTTATLAIGLNNINVTSLMPAVQTSDTWGFLFRLVNDTEFTNLSIDASLNLELSYKE